MKSEAVVKQDPAAAKVAALEEKVWILQRYGGNLTDEQVEYYLEQERIKARRPEEERLRQEREAAERARIASELKRISTEELGKRIFVSLNRARIKSFNPDGTVPCPECGGNLGTATGALQQVADLIRGSPASLYGLVDLWNGGGFGAPGQGLPCVHTGETCAHCGASVETLVQLVL